MKKMIVLVLAALMLTLAACGERGAEPDTVPETILETIPATAAPAETAVPETEAPTEPPVVIAPMEMDESILVDDENCTFSVKLASTNEHLGVTLDAVCVNKTDKNLMFTWNTVSVCGYMYDPMWSEQVAPGETVESVVFIDTYVLEQYGITSVDQIEFTLNIFDMEDFMAEPFFNDTCVIYPTGADADAYAAPQRVSAPGEQVIADNEALTFIIESIREDGENCVLRLYLRNKTEQSLFYVWDGVSVNGSAMDPLWSAEVAPGKQAYSEITFRGADLAAGGIEEVEQIDFRLIVSGEEEMVLEESCSCRTEDSALG